MKTVEMISQSFQTESIVQEGSFVSVTDNYTVGNPSSAGDVNVIGIVQKGNKTVGEKAVIATRGWKICRLKTGGAVSVGAIVNGTDGTVIHYDSATHDSAAIIGWALESAASAEEEIDILIKA